MSPLHRYLYAPVAFLLACGSEEPPASTPAPPSLLDALVDEFPAAGAVEVCADASLRLSFTTPPTLGASGKVQVFDVESPDTAVVSISSSKPSRS